jgi:hypothetical protein
MPKLPRDESHKRQLLATEPSSSIKKKRKLQGQSNPKRNNSKTKVAKGQFTVSKNQEQKERKSEADKHRELEVKTAEDNNKNQIETVHEIPQPEQPPKKKKKLLEDKGDILNILDSVNEKQEQRIHEKLEKEVIELHLFLSNKPYRELKLRP